MSPSVIAADAGIQSLLSRIRPVLEAQWRECLATSVAEGAPCTMFFVTGNGTGRAHVSLGRGVDFAAAWSAGEAALGRLWQRRGETPCWLRVEVAHSVRKLAWSDLCAQLRRTKRNYWRHGIAFDAQLRQALLPMECAGNALLYDANAAVATPNDNNLDVYARRRFGTTLRWPSDPAQSVWLFDTRAVFSDGQTVHEIEHQGRQHGYRKLPAWGADTVLEVVQRGASYLARQVKPSGEYHYGWFPCFDRAIPTYNALRHASSTYALLEAWELTGDPAHKAAVDAALAFLCGELIREAELPGGASAAFLADTGDEIKLGGNAVCLLALCKYAELTGDRRHLPLAERLALGILHMQQDDGSFVHVLNWPRLDIKQRQRIVYYDGEAAFGLMRLYAATRDPRWLAAVEKAFGYFIAAEHWRAHDHWLGYCVSELTAYRPDPRYYRFGLENVRGYLDFVLDRITTFPTLLELMMASQRMIERLRDDEDNAHLLDGFDLEKFDRALHARARYLMGGFFWPELAMFFRNPARIADGFFIKHHGYRVRIDDVEHYLSGLVAYYRHLLGASAVHAFSPPADLRGQDNGRMRAELLRPVIGGRLHWRAAQAWEAMRAAALSEGVLLEPTHCIDTYRPLRVQERVFRARYSDRQVEGSEPVVWQGRTWWLKAGCAMARVPGTSNHGWGLAIDVYRSREPQRRAWLQRHARRFGWDWTVADEPWHLDYCAGDATPPAVDAYLRGKTVALTGDGWDADNVRAATGGAWERAPDTSGWRADGVCTWAPSMRAGQMLVQRSLRQPAGVRAETVVDLAADAAAVIVGGDDVPACTGDVPVLRVADVRDAVLALGEYARSRMRGSLIGVTGSAGKTSTVAMLGDALQAFGPVNRTQHNANLPQGIAWNLASMDWQAPFTVLEMAIGRMGQNARMARPDVALVTNVTAAHLKYHISIEEIARRKARIFSGMLPGSVAVLNRDLPQWRIFAEQAARFGLRTMHYGRHIEAGVRLLEHDPVKGVVHAEVLGRALSYTLGAPGEHMVLNSLACLAAVAGMGLPLEPVLPALAGFRPLPGRGQVHEIAYGDKRLRVIDEAYNANPASMVAALRLARTLQPPLPGGRRVLVLGDMRELEPQAEVLHAALAAEVRAARPDLVLLCGEYMVQLQRALAAEGPPLHWFTDVQVLRERLAGFLESGDLVLVKSSAGTRLSELVELLLAADHAGA